MKIVLTDLAIKQLKPTGYQQRFYCAHLPNFGVRLSQHGTLCFFVDLGRQRKRVSIGKYPTITLKAARRRALDLLSSFDEPQPTTQITLSTAFQAYFERHITSNCRPATAKKLEKLISSQLPHLADRPLASIRTHELSDIIGGYKHRPAAANRLHAVLNAFLKWSVRNQYLPSSPLTFSKPHKATSRDRVLSEDELKAVYNAAVHIGFPYGFIILLCIHCGFRKTEAASLKWSYIADDVITLPKELTKQKKAHAIPNLVGANLALIPKTSDYLFPSEVGTAFTAFSHNKMRLDELCGISDFTTHDLRRTFSSYLAKWECAEPHIIELPLGHSNALTPMAKVYNRWTYLPQMRAALEKYEARLAALIAAH